MRVRDLLIVQIFLLHELKMEHRPMENRNKENKETENF